MSNLAYNSQPLDLLLADGRVVYTDVQFKGDHLFQADPPRDLPVLSGGDQPSPPCPATWTSKPWTPPSSGWHPLLCLGLPPAGGGAQVHLHPVCPQRGLRLQRDPDPGGDRPLTLPADKGPAFPVKAPRADAIRRGAFGSTAPAGGGLLFLDLLPVAPGGLLCLVVPVLIIFSVFQLIGQVLLPHPVAREVMGVAVALLRSIPAESAWTFWSSRGMSPASPAFTSAIAASMAMQAVLDLGAVARRMAASASGSLASGSPS